MLSIRFCHLYSGNQEPVIGRTENDTVLNRQSRSYRRSANDITYIILNTEKKNKRLTTQRAQQRGGAREAPAGAPRPNRGAGKVAWDESRAAGHPERRVRLGGGAWGAMLDKMDRKVRKGKGHRLGILPGA